VQAGKRVPVHAPEQVKAYFGGKLKQGLAYAQAADPTSEAGLQLSTSLELYHHRGWAKKAVDSSDLGRQ